MSPKTYVLLAALFSLLTLHAGHAAAEPGAASKIYATPLSQTDSALSGVSAARTEYFSLPPYWNVSEVRLNLDYTVTPIIKDYISSVTLSLNGSKFYSFRPSANGGKQHLTVPLPAELLVKEANALKIEGELRTTEIDQACPADITSDSWLQLANTSKVETVYTPAPFNGSIRDFNRRMSGIDTISGGHSLVAVPDGTQTAEWEAAVYALSGFARSNTLTDDTIPLLPYGPDSLKDKDFVAWIGLADRLPEGLKSQLAAVDLDRQALIQVVPAEGRQLLVATSRNPELLMKAGRFISNQTLMSQVESGVKLVDADTDTTAEASAISREVKLTENGDQLKGPSHREQTYFIDLPANRSLADASKISLDFRYSQNLDFDRSMVTLRINNTPIGSKKLNKELADGDKLVIPVPGNVAISGSFSVTAAFDLELKQDKCAPREEEMPWAYITKDSVMQVNTKDWTGLLFNNYPYPFIRDGVFNQVAVVLPKDRDLYLYRSVSNLFSLLGRYAAGNTGEVRFYEDTVDPAELKDRNVLAIGSYRNNAVIQSSNEKLYFRYSPDGARIVSNEKLSVDADYGTRVGTLQLIESPFGSGHGFMAVTGPGSEGYFLASRLLAGEKERWKVFGDGVLTDKDGSMNVFRFKKEAGAAQDSLLRDVLNRGDTLMFTVAAVLVMFLVLVSLLLLIRKHSRKRGGRR